MSTSEPTGTIYRNMALDDNLRPRDEGLGHAWVRHQGISAKLVWGRVCGGKKQASEAKPACIQPPL